MLCSLFFKRRFYAVWVSDLFMRRVEADAAWSLLDPATCPGLDRAWGDEYEALYERYEAQGLATRTLPARTVWTEILRSQTETGVPYVLFKDACNAKSNQQNLGTIRCSNLCVAGDTRVLTADGWLDIRSLAGKRVQVWNGQEFSQVTVLQTGADQPLVTVTVDTGDPAVPPVRLRCTPYHRFILADRHLDDRASAAELRPGDRLAKFDLPSGPTAEHDRRAGPTVVSVEDAGERGDTFCFDEPKRHAGVFDGVLTGNCTEIVEFTGPGEVAVCNLGSLSLPAFVLGGAFDFEGLMAATRVLARNLDRVIDVTFYPIEEARRSNLAHRPVGIGVQGLQDVFFMLNMPFDSDEARALNLQIFETVYFAAVSESCELARVHGAYSSFEGSPASRGRLQYDLWGVTPSTPYSWAVLKEDLAAHGLRNSLSVAPMPTASTANILGK